MRLFFVLAVQAVLFGNTFSWRREKGIVKAASSTSANRRNQIVGDELLKLHTIRYLQPSSTQSPETTIEPASAEEINRTAAIASAASDDDEFISKFDLHLQLDELDAASNNSTSTTTQTPDLTSLMSTAEATPMITVASSTNEEDQQLLILTSEDLFKQGSGWMALEDVMESTTASMLLETEKGDAVESFVAFVNEQCGNATNYSNFVLCYVRDNDVSGLRDFASDGRISANEAYTSANITALMLASYLGNTHVMDLLIRHGADLEAVDHVGNTALVFAVMGLQAPAVELLLFRGANLATRNRDGADLRSILETVALGIREDDIYSLNSVNMISRWITARIE